MKTQLSKMLEACSDVELKEVLHDSEAVYHPEISFTDPEGKHIRLDMDDMCWQFEDQEVFMQFEGPISWCEAKTIDGETMRVAFFVSMAFTPEQVETLNSMG